MPSSLPQPGNPPKPRGLPLLLILCLLAGGGLSPALALTDDDGDKDHPQPARSAQYRPGVVQLTPAQVLAAGLVSQALTASTLQPETATFGKVLDIQPLLDLRARLRAAVADVAVASAALRLAGKNRARIQALHDADIIAARELAQADAQWQSDLTREEAARRHVEEIHREAMHLWGDALAHLALDGHAPLLDSLAAHRRVLLQITLPSGVSLPAQGGPLFVSRDFDRARAIRAELISAAPRTDELVQGETFFFHAAAEHLRAGMRVNVWVPGGGRRHGVTLPASAIVWHGGQSWVYREDGGGGYSRLPVAGQPGGAKEIFIDSGLAPGVRVVVTGAQTLLAEEFRSHIPAEDDD